MHKSIIGKSIVGVSVVDGELNLSCNNLNDNDYLLRLISSLSSDELQNIDKKDQKAMVELMTGTMSEEILCITAPKVWFKSPAEFSARIASDFIFLAVDQLKNKYDELIDYIIRVVNQFGLISITDNILDSICIVCDNTSVVAPAAPVAECIINEFAALVSIKNLLKAIEVSTPGDRNRAILDLIDDNDVYAGVAVVAGPGDDLVINGMQDIGSLNKVEMCRMSIHLNLGQTGREMLTQDTNAHDNAVGLVLMVKRLILEKEMEDIDSEVSNRDEILETWLKFVENNKNEED